jgi:hypothetical protein
MLENRHGRVVDLETTLATGTAERDAAKVVVERSVKRDSTLGADKNYGGAKFIFAIRGHELFFRTVNRDDRAYRLTKTL